MKKDIITKNVQGVIMAICPRDDDDLFWDAYIINTKSEVLKNVIVCSEGYGELNGEIKKTSTFRFFFDEIKPNSFVKVEMVDVKLLHFTHEYWLSFSLEEYLYDKRYIFVNGSINTLLLSNIPILEKKGIKIQ